MSSFTKDELFNDHIGKNDEDKISNASSVYYGWGAEDLKNITDHSDSRRVYYDSNIAFTDGNGSIVGADNAGVLAVPDLYGTLKGLNDRINTVSNTNTTSSADARLYVDEAEGENEFVIAPGNGKDDSKNMNATAITANKAISLQNAPATDETPVSKFTVKAEDFAFKVGNNEVTIINILQMIEELNKRTITISNNQLRDDISFTNKFFNHIDRKYNPDATEEQSS